MENRTKIYRTPIVHVIIFNNDVITASTVEGQGNDWNINANPWETEIMEGAGE